MVQINHIKKLHRKKGFSLRGIARHTGYDFRTVQKYINKDDFNRSLEGNRGRPSKMEVYKEVIDSWLKMILRILPSKDILRSESMSVLKKSILRVSKLVQER